MSYSENAALFERLVEIHSNPPILYYGFNFVNRLFEVLIKHTTTLCLLMISLDNSSSSVLSL